jgi:hypothetical protein
VRKKRPRAPLLLLRRQLRRAGITQVSLAAEARVTRSCVSRVLHGTATSARVLATAYHLLKNHTTTQELAL